MRAALAALVVAVVLGVSYWAYASIRDEYTLRAAIQLNSVSMTGGGSGWAVGEIGGKPNTVLMRADAGRWTILPKPAGLDNMATLQAVAMTSPQDGWLIAQNPIWKHDRYHTFIPGSVLLRYHAGQWRIASRSIPHQLWALTMRTADDGWAVGSDGAILHLEWRRMVADTCDGRSALQRPIPVRHRGSFGHRGMDGGAGRHAALGWHALAGRRSGDRAGR
jgi:hypothetical protein